MKNGIIYVIITALLFATHEPVSKLFAGVYDPYSVTAIRFLIGGLVLLPFSILEIKKKNIKLTGKDFLVLTGLGVLFICVSMVLLQVAVAEADNPAVIAIIFSSNSIITIVLSSFILKNKMTALKIVGVILCAAGVLIAADFSKGGSNVLSIILAVLSALTFSTYTVLSKKFMTKISGIIQTGFSFVIGSVILFIAIALLGIVKIEGVNTVNAMQLLYISVLVTGVGYWAYFSAMRIGGPQTAAITFLIKPVLSPIATFLIVSGVAMNWTNIIIALVLVVCGSTLATGTKMPWMTKKEQ